MKKLKKEHVGSDGLATGFAAGMFVVVAMWVAYLSWHPLRFENDLGMVWANLVAGSAEMRWPRVGAHLVVFMFLGGVLALATNRMSTLRRLLFGLIVLALFCIVIEVVQAAAVKRHARPGDLLVNVAASHVGFLAVALVFRRFIDPLPWLSRHVRAISRTVVVAAVLVMAFIVIDAHLGADDREDLQTWNRDFRLAVGNELTGERPWSGTLATLAIYPRGLSDEEIQELATDDAHTSSGRNMRRRLGVSALYTIDEGEGRTIRDHAARAEPLDLVIADPEHCRWRVNGTGVVFTHPTIAASKRPARTISEAIASSGTFTIEVRGSTSQPHQTGPARIVTISADPEQRNFTIGQDNADLIMRVRTPRNGANGSRYVGRWSDVFDNVSTQHIVVSYVDSEMTLFVDGERRGPTFAMYSISAWMGLQDPLGPLVVGALVFAPVGMCGIYSARTAGAWRGLVGVLSLGVLPVLAAHAIASAVSDRSVDTVFVIAAITGCLAGFLFSMCQLGLGRLAVSGLDLNALPNAGRKVSRFAAAR